jgi:beta-galactosidase
MNAEKRITVRVNGVGELLALGSACPITEEKYQNDSFTSYQGRVLAVVRSFGEPGTIRVTAAAEGLEDGCAEIAVQ